MAYLYRHIRLDKNEPFYIGISNDRNYNRAYSKQKRNKIWNRIVSKTEYEVEILMDNLTYDEVKKKEVEFIKLYGRINLNNGTLANLTDGGDGAIGALRDENFKKKISNFRKGKKHSKSTKEKMSKAQIGNQKGKGYRHTKEAIEKIRKASTDRIKLYWENKKKGSVETPPDLTKN